MKLRVKEVAKRKNIGMVELAKMLNKSYNALYNRLDNPTLKSLQEIANVLDCEIIELIECGSDYSHFYDEKTGKYLGVRQK